MVEYPSAHAPLWGTKLHWDSLSLISSPPAQTQLSNSTQDPTIIQDFTAPASDWEMERDSLCVSFLLPLFQAFPLFFLFLNLAPSAQDDSSPALDPANEASSLLQHQPTAPSVSFSPSPAQAALTIPY